MRRPEVRPLTEVRLAKNHGTRGTQACGDTGIASRAILSQRERSGAGAHPIAGIDVVLEENRHAMQRTERASRGTLCIGRIGQCQRVGIDLDDAVHTRAIGIQCADAHEVVLGQRA